MLHELRIENLLLIERAELRLEPGLNAITGETGAGKTVLAHSLDLLMGGRARPQIVRPGAEEAWVEGVFELPAEILDDPELAEIAARLPDDADEVVLGRRVGASGRTSAFIGGRAASAAELRALGSRLLAFYGQHEHRRLMLASAQLEILDGFAGEPQLELRDGYRAAHAEATGLTRELAELREREGSRERDLDLMRFELSEIEAAAPDAGGGGGARRRERRPAQRRGPSRRSRQGAGGRRAAPTRTAAGRDRRSAKRTRGSPRSPASTPSSTRSPSALRAAAVELDDLAGGLRAYLDGIEAEPGRLDAVEERLDALDRLKRKHGGSIEAVLAHAERCRAEIERL